VEVLCQVIDMSHTQLIAVSVPMYIADVSIVRSGHSLRIEPKNSTANFVGIGSNGVYCFRCTERRLTLTAADELTKMQTGAE